MIIQQKIKLYKLFERISIAVTAISLAALPFLVYPLILKNTIFSHAETWGLVFTCTLLGMLFIFALCALVSVLLEAFHQIPEMPDSTANRVITAITVFAFVISFVFSLHYICQCWQVFI